VPTAALIPYARNARTHSDAQVAQIAASITEWGWTTPILVDEQNNVIAGHGRLLAAQKLGMQDVPVVVAAGWSDAKRRAYVLADNKLALNSGWDEELLALELSSLSADEFDLALTGFTEDELVELLTGSPDSEGLDDNYSRKIVAPIYEPKGDKPPVDSLFDDEKTRQLIAAIDSAEGLPGDVAEFLRHAARRHTVFHFARIAEFYAHAPPHLQELMEDSALVIIDFQKAIENGFVHMTERLGKLADSEDWRDEG
jgi:hypothetical protein